MNDFLSHSTRPTRLAALAALFFLFAAPACAGDAYEWSQFTPDGVELRAVTQEASCPKASIDGRPAEMAVRAAPDAAFPVLVCALPVPRAAKEAAIRDRPMPLRVESFERVALVGDTGCRLNVLVLQGCNSMKDWPFRMVADAIAEMAPQLVLHLGDLIYRERACPIADKACAGSPWGDDWETWKAEFFDPAHALLSVAPFVFVRGNHEDCARNGAGWNRFVGPFPFAPACQPQEAPYKIDLGGLTLAVLDVTRAEDRGVDAALVPLFRAQFAWTKTLGGPVWIAMHKGVWGSARLKDGVNEGHNLTLGEAARGAIPPNVAVLVSGHLHVFQAMSFAEDFPAQIISGAGGDVLDRLAPQDIAGKSFGDATVENGRGVSTLFGFTIMQRGESDWLLTHYDAHERPLAQCRLNGRKLACE